MSKEEKKSKERNDNHIMIDCSNMNSKATIELASQVLEIIKKRYEPLVMIKVVATKD